MPKLTFFNLLEEKQKQIIDVAIKEFSNYTFNEVKISNIIKNAKIPRSSFYDYFEDKFDIYKYILELIGKEKIKYYEPIMKADKEDFFEYLKALFKAGAKFTAYKPEYDKIAKKLLSNMDLAEKLFGKEKMDVSHSFLDVLEIGIENGTIRKDIDLKFTSKILSILSSQLLIEGSKEDKTLDVVIDEMSNKMIEFIKIGIGNKRTTTSNYYL